MISNLLLSVGIVLTAASQLRLPGLPLGPGELFLGLWLAVASFRAIGRNRISNPSAFFRIGAFWLVFGLGLSLGTCVVLLHQEFDLASMRHDAFAYLLAAALSSLIVATMSVEIELRQTAWLVVGLWDVALLFQIAIGWDFLSISWIEPWFWDRFRGWSENPNQVALYCAVLTPLSLHLALSSRGIARLASLLSGALFLVVGRLTKSDTFLIAALAGTALFGALQLRGWLTLSKYRSSFRFGAAVLITSAAIPLLLALSPYALALASDAEAFALGLAKDGGGEGTKHTASVRLQLWEDAVLIGLTSASLGLGPGPHLEKPNVADHQFLPAPFEAHNVLLDVFTQAGLIGVLAVGGLVTSTLVLLLHRRLDALAVLIVTLGVFSITHFILRHPIVWFVLALCVACGLTGTRSPEIHGRAFFAGPHPRSRAVRS